jgi:hypothetical protein
VSTAVRYHGIDYGKRGAWAQLDARGNLLDVVDMPLVDGEYVDAARLAEGVARNARVTLERFLPRFSNESQARSAMNYGRVLCGLEAAIGYGKVVEVRAEAWKRHFGLVEQGSKSSTAERKGRSVAHAEALFGRKFRRHDHAEAALIARYGWETRKVR